MSATSNSAPPDHAKGQKPDNGRGEKAPSAGDYVPGQMLVRFDPTTPESDRRKVRQRHGLQKVKDLSLLPGLELMQTNRGGSIPDHATAVAKERVVRYAEPNRLRYVAATTDDPANDNLWAFGQPSDEDADVFEGWDIAADTSGIIVAVLDEGIDIEHADLAASIWVNAAEAAGTPGSDDDGNIYKDDINGWDFNNNDATVYDGVGDDHGTHVAGTIGAVADNGLGVAGVSRAQLMSLKFMEDGVGPISAEIEAIAYAVDKGADVINASFGGLGDSNAEAEAIQTAIDAGMVFVAAAGNQTEDNDDPTTAHYPASYGHDGLISVAATDRFDQLASFSNYGAATVDVGAPGVSILSTIPDRFAKVVLGAYGGNGGKTATHSFGLEGVSAAEDREAIMTAALAWTGIDPTTDSVLVVDDDMGSTFEDEHSIAVTAAGYSVSTSAQVGDCLDGPTLTELQAHDVVVWVAGREYRHDPPCGLTALDQSNLRTYVEGGNHLVVFGQNLVESLEMESLNGGSSFHVDVLDTDLHSFADEDFALSGVAGTGTGYEGINVTLETSDLLHQRWSDALTPVDASGAIVAMTGTGPLGYKSGTSMATPLVSGIAAQVMAKFPTMDPADVKQRIMDTGDPVTLVDTGGDPTKALEGNTVSGNRVNLYNALAAGTLTGRVSFDGTDEPEADPPKPEEDPVENACVTVWEGLDASHSMSTRADSSGVYTLVVPTGSYKIQFRDCAPPYPRPLMKLYAATEWYDGATGAIDLSSAVALAVGDGTSTTIDASMDTAGSIEGMVSASGPPSGICVDAFLASGSWVASARTDSAGAYELMGLPMAEHRLRFKDCTGNAFPLRYATEWWKDSYDNNGYTPVAVTVSQPHVILLEAAEMASGGAIQGFVTSSTTDVPLPGVCVAGFTENGAFIDRARTDESGFYEMSGFGPDSYKVRFTDCAGRGYLTEWHEDKNDFSTATPVPVTPGSASAVSAQLAG